jgi:hypothetical protein
MNIKQFLVLNICSNLPCDITDIIWKEIQDDAADTIRKMYEFKIKKNIDIFLYLVRYNTDAYYLGDNNELFRYEMVNALNNYFKVDKINRFMEYAYRNLSYNYIEEHGTWIQILNSIRRVYVNNLWFDADALDKIVDKIRNNNPNYQITGISWWEHF